MPPIVALIIFTVLVLVLLRIERGRNPEASWALWLPTIWILIRGSRPVGLWFGPNLGQSEQAGSPLDRLVLSILIVLALLVLFRRKIDWSRILKDNSVLIFLYLYLAFSILWSDFPYVSAKRWIKFSGTIPLALVVLSERSPLKALESIFRRCAYVLIPISLLLIKYFPHLAVQYHHHSLEQMRVGVSTQKNPFGLMCAVSVFFFIWAFLRDRQAGDLLKSKSRVFAEVLVFGIAVYLLHSAHSATAIGMLIIGIALLLILSRKKKLVRPIANLAIIGAPLLILSLDFYEPIRVSLTSIVGRDSSFTGRTIIWNAVRDIASRAPWFGVGFGGYWGLGVDEIISTLGVSETHNGYLEVYLSIGMVGFVLLLAFLLAHYRKMLRELDHSYDWGVFGICFLVMLLLANYTEGSLLKASFMWSILVFITIVFSGSSLHKNGD